MPARRGRPRRASAPGRSSATTTPRGGRSEAAWREFAASFVRAGMVPPADTGLAAVEAAEGAAVLLLAPQQVGSARGGQDGPAAGAAASRRLPPAGADFHREVPPALPVRCRPCAGLRHRAAPAGAAGLLAAHTLRAGPGGAARRPPARRRPPAAPRRRPRRYASAPGPPP